MSEFPACSKEAIVLKGRILALSWCCWACIAGTSPAWGAPPILMTYWSDNTARFAGYPIPGSVAASGATQTNPPMQRQLDAINVLAYGFLQADAAGQVQFGNPAIDRLEGSFAAFAHLDNRTHTLQKIISIGGADSQSSLDNALNHPVEFVRSAAALIHEYHLDGIDLDFEPDTFFGPGQGERYAQLIASLRQSLGPAAFISIEVPADRETLRSIDCPADAHCRNDLALIAADAYVSLMGYDYHHPDYPGTRHRQ